jgi:hypothetical protein
MKKLAFILLFIIGNQLVFAHGGEDHGEKKKESNKAGQTYFRLSSVSDVFEMVLRYEPIQAGNSAQMKLFVSDFSTNRATDSAKIEITSPEDDKLKFVAKQIDKGTYIVEGTFPENKSYSLVANISAEDNADLMTFEGIEVGKKLSLPEEEHTEHSFFSWQMLLVFLGGMIFSALFIFLLIRRKINYNKR